VKTLIVRENTYDHEDLMGYEIVDMIKTNKEFQKFRVYFDLK